MAKTLLIAYIACSSFLISSKVSGKPQADSMLKLDLFKSTLDSFMISVKKQVIMKGKYDVYVAYFYDADSSQNNFCFTLSHIFNASEIEYNQIAPTHYFLYNGEFVLVKFTPVCESELALLGLKKNDEETKKAIFQKLHPIRINGWPAGITGSPIGLVGCIVNDTLHKMSYRNAYDIPEEFSVYGSLPKFIATPYFGPEKSDKKEK